MPYLKKFNRGYALFLELLFLDLVPSESWKTTHAAAIRCKNEFFFSLIWYLSKKKPCWNLQGRTERQRWIGKKHKFNIHWKGLFYFAALEVVLCAEMLYHLKHSFPSILVKMRVYSYLGMDKSQECFTQRIADFFHSFFRSWKFLSGYIESPFHGYQWILRVLQLRFPCNVLWNVNVLVDKGKRTSRQNIYTKSRTYLSLYYFLFAFESW